MTKISLPPSSPPPSNVPPSKSLQVGRPQVRAPKAAPPGQAGGDAELAAAAQKFRRTLHATPSKSQSPTDNAAKQAAHSPPEKNRPAAADTARRAAQGDLQPAREKPPPPKVVAREKSPPPQVAAQRVAQDKLQPAREKAPPPKVAAQGTHNTPDKHRPTAGASTEGDTARRAAQGTHSPPENKRRTAGAPTAGAPTAGVEVAQGAIPVQDAVPASASGASVSAPEQAAEAAGAAQEVAELVDRIASRLSLDTSPDGTKTLSLELKGEAFGRGTVLDLQFSAEQGLVLQFRGAEAQHALPHRAALLQQLQTHTDLPVAIRVTPDTDPDEQRQPPPDFEIPEEED